MPNPIILNERPLMGILRDDYQDMEKTGHITFGKTADGLHIARMTQNGHQFIATHAEQMKAAAAVQQQVENADAEGRTAIPAHMKVK